MNTRTYSEKWNQVSPTRLWFGFAAAAAAWAIHGLMSVFVSWQACQDGDHDWGVLSGGEVRWLLAAISLAALAVVVAAGMTAFRNWRQLSRERELTRAEGRGRAEFMALGGIFVSASFLVGILWAALPLLLLDICVKAR